MINSPLVRSPGWGWGLDRNIGERSLGRQLRDELLWQYPIMGGAVFIYTQMVSGLTYTVSSNTTAKARKALETLHTAEILNRNGEKEYGLENLLLRQALDFISIGRWFYAFSEGKIEYLDPTDMVFSQENNTKAYWNYYHPLAPRRLPSENVQSYKALPLGATGHYRSPIANVLPSAILAWLIREHDTASADGRKIRDIYVTLNGVKSSLEEAIRMHMEAYQSVNFNSNNVPVIEVDVPMGVSAGDLDMSKLIHRIGVSEIPQGYNRTEEEFKYVNEIAAALGISLRHFWNSERATNRALEEVQEARQQQKGPTYLARTWARKVNSPNVLTTLGVGTETKFGFIEEVDLQSQETRAEVLKLYAESFSIFADKLGDQVSLSKLITWLQSEHQLPPDIQAVAPRNFFVSDPLPIPKDVEKTLSELPYNHVLLDMNGEVLGVRRNVYVVPDMLTQEYASNSDFQELAEMLSHTEVADYVTVTKRKIVDAAQKNWKRIEKSLPEVTLEELESADNTLLLKMKNVLTELNLYE